MNKPIKLFLLTGFFGAGKTTFLQNVLQNSGQKKIGLIINEFGKLGIDGALIQREGIDILELNNGSVFCSCLKQSFIEGLITYASLPIEYLIVESSGMSDPSNIRHILQTVVDKKSVRSYEYRGTVCLVDAPRFFAQAEVLNVIEKQIAVSDLVIINKTDLTDAETVKRATEYICDINSGAKIYSAVHANIAPDILTANLTEEKLLLNKKIMQESIITMENRPKSLVLCTEQRIDVDVWQDFLRSIALYVFRIKGFIVNAEGCYRVDVTGEEVAVKLAETMREKSELVIISQKEAAIIRNIFYEWEKRVGGKMVLK